MNRKIFLSATILIAIISFFNFPNLASAMVPTLSVMSTGSGDNVQINVNGDSNVSVLLFTGTQMAVLGNTNSSGIFSTTISSATAVPNGIVSNAIVYVKTNGLSGTQSNSVSWPYIQSSTTSGTLTLTQNALLLNAGQNSTITANANSLYLLSNSSPSIANVNFNANQITVQAITYGSTVANVCVVGSTTNCANITVTVQNSGASQLTFSQNNFSIYSGQNIAVTVSGGSGNYTILNNSNSSAVQANLNGSTVTLIAGGSTGSASVTICTTDTSACGIINVNATTVNSTAVTFSQTNPVVQIGQTTTVTIYGGAGTNFYVASNSNPSIVQANIVGSILTLIGSSNTGIANISVCAYAGSCGSVVANVSSASTGGALTLSQSTVSVLAGQSLSITISGGSIPYTFSAPNSNSIVSGAINGNVLTIYGVNVGTATANVCSSAGCTTLSVTVNSTTSSGNPPTFSQNNILLTAGQQTTIYVSGTGSYYLANNSNSGIASAQVSANAVTVSAMMAGTTNISICQNGSQCATLYITVSGTTNNTAQLVLSQTSLSLTVGQNTSVTISGNGNYYVSSNSTPSVALAQISVNSINVSGLSVGTDTVLVCQSSGQCSNMSVTVSAPTPIISATPTVVAYIFPRYLGFNDKGEDVLKLQQILAKKGYLSSTPNGHYGPATFAAVKLFQKANGIRQTGNVGVSTKDALNKLEASSEVSSNTDQNSLLQQQIQQLLAQVAQMQNR
jgi:hypothetical protein